MINNIQELCREIGVKHGCVGAASQVVGSVQCPCPCPCPCPSVAVEFTTSLADALGVDSAASWPVIEHLWDHHGYMGVWEAGVIWVYMSGVVARMYVAGIVAYEDMGIGELV